MQVNKQQLELDMELDWFKIWKGVHQGCILLPNLFNLYAEYIIQNADEVQAGIKIVGRNTNNLRYADDTTLMAEGDSLVVRMVKNPPAVQETPVRFLAREDPLEKGQATHSSILGLPWWLRW